MVEALEKYFAAQSENETIVERLNEQVLRNLKISLVSGGLDKRKHLRLAACFQRAGLAILETLAE